MLLRIDDVDLDSYTQVEKILRWLSETSFSIYLCIIGKNWKDIDIEHLMNIRNNIHIMYHWFYHEEWEFLSEKKQQIISLQAWEEMWKKFENNQKIFCPAFNNMNGDTLNLLQDFSYTHISIDYKWVEKYYLYNSGFDIITTNVFLNKKNKDGIWFTEKWEHILKDAQYINDIDIPIWFELHPQYISSTDIENIIWLLLWYEEKYA